MEEGIWCHYPGEARKGWVHEESIGGEASDLDPRDRTAPAKIERWEGWHWACLGGKYRILDVREHRGRFIERPQVSTECKAELCIASVSCWQVASAHHKLCCECHLVPMESPSPTTPFRLDGVVWECRHSSHARESCAKSSHRNSSVFQQVAEKIEHGSPKKKTARISQKRPDFQINTSHKVSTLAGDRKGC